MKKVFVFLLIILCNGCFFEKKETLDCLLINNVGDVKITNNYKFIYKKDEISEILLNISFDCKKESSQKVYENYVKIYNELKENNNSLLINYNKEECSIEVNTILNKNKNKTLSSLNLGFLDEVNIDELRENLKNTEYQCK